MLRSRLRRTALVAAGILLAIAAALTLGRPPERTAPIEAPSQATEPADLSADLRRCAALDETRIEEAGCMAVWEESRRRFFGEPAHPHAPAPAPVRSPAPGVEPADPEASTAAPAQRPDAGNRKSMR